MNIKTENKKKTLRFSEEIIFSLTLAGCLSDRKAKCEFFNIDIAADKVLRYKSIRSTIYRVHKECFGPAMTIEYQEDLTKEKR